MEQIMSTFGKEGRIFLLVPSHRLNPFLGRARLLQFADPQDAMSDPGMVNLASFVKLSHSPMFESWLFHS
jgi:hypothetical protein